MRRLMAWPVWPVLVVLWGVGGSSSVVAQDTPQEFMATLERAYQENYPKYTKNLDIEAVCDSFGDKDQPTEVTSRDHYVYQSSANRFTLESKDQTFPVDVYMGTPETIYCIRVLDAKGTSKITEQIMSRPKNFHSRMRVDESGVGLQLASFEVSALDYLKLPDVRLEKVTHEVWDGSDLTCVVCYRPQRGGVREYHYFDHNQNYI